MWLRRIFWPGDGDAEWAATFGGWVILVVGVYLGARALLRGQAFLGMLDLALYTIGAAGTRLRSKWATGLGWLWIALGVGGNLLMGLSPATFESAALVLMTGSVRASWLPKEQAETAASLGWLHQASQKLWRIGKFPFLPIVGSLVVLTLWGTTQAVSDGGMKNIYSIEQDGAEPKR